MKTAAIVLIMSFFWSLVGNDSAPKETIVFLEENDLKKHEIDKGQTLTIGAGLWPADEDALLTDKVIYSKADLNYPLITEEHFLQGVYSPYNGNEFYFSDIPNVEVASKLYKYDTNTGAKVVVFDENAGPEAGHCYVPIAFGATPDILYLQEIDIAASHDYLGIWKYNLVSNTFQKLNVNANYMSTPILSEDRTKFYYTVASDPNRDVIHGLADQVIEFDLQSSQERLIHTSNGKQTRIIGVMPSTSQLQTISQTTYNQNLMAKLPVTNWYLPFSPGEDWCVTRDGTPAPPAPYTGLGSSSCNYNFNDHGYRALDWSNLNFPNSNNNQGPIVAAGQGLLVSRTSACGYGNLVRLSHDIGSGVTLYTYYAHLASFIVPNTPGICVGQGEGVGIEGGNNATCAPYGVHLHFEVRVSLSGSGQQTWIPFADMNNGHARTNDRGTSANNYQPCCALNYTTSTGNVTGDVFTGNSITSAGTIPVGANVEFSAGNSVDLIPGFDAVSGCIFDANIGGCSAKTSIGTQPTTTISENPVNPK